MRPQKAPWHLTGNLSELPIPHGISEGLLYYADDAHKLFYLVIDQVTNVRHWDLVNGSLPGGPEIVQVVPFDHSTPSPMLLAAVSPGATLNRATVKITVPFDGLGASVSMGTTTSPGLVLGSGDVYPGTADQYESDELIEFDANDFLQFFINPSGSTRGAGLLLFKMLSELTQ